MYLIIIKSYDGYTPNEMFLIENEYFHMDNKKLFKLIKKIIDNFDITYYIWDETGSDNDIKVDVRFSESDFELLINNEYYQFVTDCDFGFEIECIDLRNVKFYKN